LKELIGPLLDEIDPTAAGINSVNTIVNNDGTLRGYSTDGEGLLWDLQDKGAMPSPASSVLVLGAGGAARAIVYAFVKQGFTVSISNRTIVRAQRLAADLDVDARVIEWSSGSLSAAARRAALVVNTTTLGMHDSGIEDLAIFEPDCITTGQTLYDIVYAPPETAMMKIARGGGAKAFNGLGMLVRQGALSLKLWTGLDLSEMPVEAMEIALAEYLP
jgi:shikimate dehydrogenase